MLGKKFKVFWIWASLRFEEGRHRSWRSSNAKGLSLIDGALTMAVVRIPMKNVRFLIEAGANPAVHNHLPFRMAAAEGDVSTMAWLMELSTPSEYAFEDALRWANGKQKPEAARFLQNLKMAGQ